VRLYPTPPTAISPAVTSSGSAAGPASSAVSTRGPRTNSVSTEAASRAYAERRIDSSGTIVDHATRMAGLTGGNVIPTRAAAATSAAIGAPATVIRASATSSAAEDSDVPAITRGWPTRSIRPPHNGAEMAVANANAPVTRPALVYEPRTSAISTTVPSGVMAIGSRATNAQAKGSATRRRRRRRTYGITDSSNAMSAGRLRPLARTA
jgi:hypothetical protein